MLIAYKTNTHSKNNAEKTPLDLAKENGDQEAVKILEASLISAKSSKPLEETTQATNKVVEKHDTNAANILEVEQWYSIFDYL